MEESERPRYLSGFGQAVNGSGFDRQKAEVNTAEKVEVNTAALVEETAAGQAEVNSVERAEVNAAGQLANEIRKWIGRPPIE